MPGIGNVINYIVPVDSMTITDQKQYREAAVSKLMERARAKNLGDMPDVRDLQLNLIDFVAAPTTDDWQTAALAAVNGFYTCFAGQVSPQVPVNRVICYYGVNILTIPNPVSRLIFRKGGVAGNIAAVFDLEKLESFQNIAGFFTQPVVYDPQDIYAAQVRAKIATGAVSRVVLWALVAEPRGTTIA